LGFACFRLNGQGEKPEEYVAMLRLGDLVELLRAAGYENRRDSVKDSDITRCLDCGIYALGERCKFCRDEQ